MSSSRGCRTTLSAGLGVQDSRNLRLYWIRCDLVASQPLNIRNTTFDKPESMDENEAIPAILSGSKIIVNRRFATKLAISLKAIAICCNVQDIEATLIIR